MEEYRKKLENIRVRGKDCPKPVKTWAQTGVSLKILEVLKKSVNCIEPACYFK